MLGTKTVLIRTRKPEAVSRVLRYDLRSVGCDFPRAVAGEGDGSVGAGRFTGGKWKYFCRETVPSLVEGRSIAGPILENVGPILHWKLNEAG